MIFAKKCTIFYLSICTIMSASYAGAVERYLQKQQEKNTPFNAERTIQSTFFKQLITHEAPLMGTFAQRYYIDETYGQGNDSPVFFYICGESSCTKHALNGAIRNYAKKFHAKLVALEHRYYGESLPTNSLSTNDLRFLNTKEALYDLAYFQRHLQTEHNWTGKWVAFGGSYPGSLSAYYRLKFPDLIVGALASSAPVMAKEDFFEYDAHVTKVAGVQCANQMREAVREVEASLNDEAQLNQMKLLFDAVAVSDPVDFLYLIADTGAAAVQYGMRDFFCNSLSTSSTPLEGYAAFAKNLYKNMQVTALEMTAQGAMSENPEDYNDLGMRQWYYQSCKEYGYWQNAHANANFSTRSSLINLAYHHKICQRLFGLHEPANTIELNNTLYFPLLDAHTSNIYFTNGQNDPWSTLSLTEKNGNAINSNLTYQLIQGASHCDDLRRPSFLDSNALKAARNTMEFLLAEWLR